MEDKREESRGAGEGEPEPTAQMSGESPPVRPRRLLRSRDDRMLAGVAGGLSEYFSVDPVIIRIAFAVSILFGGLGLVAYLALALFVPSDDGSEHPQAPVQSSRIAFMAGALFLVVIAIPAIGGGLFWGGAEGVLWAALPIALAIAVYAAVRDSAGSARGTLWAVVVAGIAAIGLFVLMAAAAFVTALGNGVATALVLVAIGALLIALAFAGGGRWLILPALAIGLGTGIAAASELDLEGGVGERTYRPASVASIPAEGYRLGVGRLAVDLRELDWRGQTVELDTDLGIGQTYVAVPERVCVVADARVRLGELNIAGERTDGVEVKQGSGPPPAGGPTLLLRADEEIGEVRVVNDDGLSIDHARGGESAIPGSELRTRNAEACAR